MFPLENLMEARSNVSFHTSLEDVKDFFFSIMTWIWVLKQPMPLINSVEISSVSMSWAIRVEQFAMRILSP